MDLFKKKKAHIILCITQTPIHIHNSSILGVSSPPLPFLFPKIHGSMSTLQTGINRQQENNKVNVMQIFILLNPARDMPGPGLCGHARQSPESEWPLTWNNQPLTCQYFDIRMQNFSQFGSSLAQVMLTCLHSTPSKHSKSNIALYRFFFFLKKRKAF